MAHESLVGNSPESANPGRSDNHGGGLIGPSWSAEGFHHSVFTRGAVMPCCCRLPGHRSFVEPVRPSLDMILPLGERRDSATVIQGGRDLAPGGLPRSGGKRAPRAFCSTLGMVESGGQPYRRGGTGDCSLGSTDGRRHGDDRT